MGPGTITTLVLLAGNGTIGAYLTVAAALGLVILMLGVVLFFASSSGT